MDSILRFGKFSTGTEENAAESLLNGGPSVEVTSDKNKKILHSD